MFSAGIGKPRISSSVRLCIGQRVWGLGLPINFAGRPFYMVGILGFKVALCLAYLRILHASGNLLYKIGICTVLGVT